MIPLFINRYSVMTDGQAGQSLVEAKMTPAGLSEIKVIFSDTHLGAGHAPGIVNPFEDFHHDRELSDLIRHYSTGEWADVPVELFINGDFLDTIKIPFEGHHTTEITEEASAWKVARCIKGHPAVFDALAAFAGVPGHTITYNAGNHDIDVAWPLVQKVLRARLGVLERPEAMTFITDNEFIRLPMGVIICHGNGFESLNRIPPGQAITSTSDGRKILNLPLGSRYLIECLVPVKGENPVIDHVSPLSTYMLYGLIFESRFTMKLLARSIAFFLRTRLGTSPDRGHGLLQKARNAIEQISLFTDFDRQMRAQVRNLEEFSTLITGHSHRPMVRRFPGNRTYVNTGSWTRTIRLELDDLGARNDLTYAIVGYPRKGPPMVNLMKWHGFRQVTEVVTE